jgi:hypothetical protein
MFEKLLLDGSYIEFVLGEEMKETHDVLVAYCPR